MHFQLDSRLAADSFFVTDLPLSQVRLMNNARFPWLLLIPRCDNLREITDLSPARQHRLLDELTLASKILQALTNAYKMNIGALGNVVPQLHIHVIARFESDSAWPSPVWGTGGDPYPEERAQVFIRQLRDAFSAK